MKHHGRHERGLAGYLSPVPEAGAEDGPRRRAVVRSPREGHPNHSCDAAICICIVDLTGTRRVKG